MRTPSMAPRADHARADVRHAEPSEVVDGGMQPGGLGDGRRARLELERHLGPGSAGQRHLVDHAAAGQEGRHRLEQLASGPQRPDARRAEHLVPRQGQEVDAELDDVDRHVRHALRGVEDDQGAGLVRHASDLDDRVDGAERVAHVADGDELR
jgi:hypothetical protein